MGRQRNWPQMKEQENSPEKELNEMEASNLSHIELKAMVIKVLNSIKKAIIPIKNRNEIQYLK